MTIPGLILGTLVGALVGAMLHLVVGGNLGRLILYLLLSVIGFWAGHVAAGILGWTFFSVGPVHLGMAILICLGVTLFGYWLSLVQTVKKT